MRRQDLASLYFVQKDYDAAISEFSATIDALLSWRSSTNKPSLASMSNLTGFEQRVLAKKAKGPKGNSSTLSNPKLLSSLYYHRGKCHQANSRFLAAINDYTLALTFDANDHRSSLARGVCHLSLSSTSRVQPDSVERHLSLAQADFHSSSLFPISKQFGISPPS
eukprot:TRINITY_DN355_c0_g1_i1.p1 TRINITY_DN355_c0_g1~~TRINITY_DN355_c0_g1_i1.p1  ORF type:complete len:165 (-),score=28.81 TRINITY_DN355_c0_g1_i1:174-668(-)